MPERRPVTGVRRLSVDGAPAMLASAMRLVRAAIEEDVDPLAWYERWQAENAPFMVNARHATRAALDTSAESTTPEERHVTCEACHWCVTCDECTCDDEDDEPAYDSDEDDGGECTCDMCHDAEDWQQGDDDDPDPLMEGQ